MQQNLVNQLGRFHKSQSSENQENSAIHIISDQNGSTNQMLIVYLCPYTMVWYKGIILTSSHPILKQTNRQDVLNVFTDSIKLKTKAPRSLQNLSNQTCYYIIKKPKGFDGKILLINKAVYQQHFYIDFQKLLTINLDAHQYELFQHPKIKYLRKIHPKDNLPVPLVFTLQSKRDNTIIEKYLAPSEKLFIPHASIVALSETTKVSYTQKTHQIYISGPGFVFFEPQTKQNIHPSFYNNMNYLFLAVVLLFAINFI